MSGMSLGLLSTLRPLLPLSPFFPTRSSVGVGVSGTNGCRTRVQTFAEGDVGRGFGKAEYNQHTTTTIKVVHKVDPLPFDQNTTD